MQYEQRSPQAASSAGALEGDFMFSHSTQLALYDDALSPVVNVGSAAAVAAVAAAGCSSTAARDGGLSLFPLFQSMESITDWLPYTASFRLSSGSDGDDDVCGPLEENEERRPGEMPLGAQRDSRLSPRSAGRSQSEPDRSLFQVVSSHGQSVRLPTSGVAPGTDLNIAPSNWLQRDDVHLAHMSVPWHPVISSFGMVDMCASLLTEANAAYGGVARSGGPRSRYTQNSGTSATTPSPDADASRRSGSTDPSTRDVEQIQKESDADLYSCTSDNETYESGGPGADRPQPAPRAGTSDGGDTDVRRGRGCRSPYRSGCDTPAAVGRAGTPSSAPEHADPVGMVPQHGPAGVTASAPKGQMGVGPTDVHARAGRVAGKLAPGASTTPTAQTAKKGGAPPAGRAPKGAAATEDVGQPDLRSAPDIICNMEDMKQLIMAPYVSTPLSFVVHRVGPSLVMEGVLPHHPPTAADARNAAIESKLLYYSVLTDCDETPPFLSRTPATGNTGAVDPEVGGAPHPIRGAHSSRIPVDGSSATSAGGAAPKCCDEALLHHSVCEGEVPAYALGNAGGANDNAQPPSDFVGCGDGPRESSARDPYFRKVLHWGFNDLHLLLGTNTPTFYLPGTTEEFTLRVKQHRGANVSPLDSQRAETGAAEPPAAAGGASPAHPGAPGLAAQSSGPLPLSPISKVEALDLWLENIMTNVSGAALCFHSDGVVQGFQVVSTKDLPTMGTEPFEPIAVQRGAANVMQWLTRCCEANGSYVLIKNPHESTLRLYSLSPLCSPTSSWHTYYMAWRAYVAEQGRVDAMSRLPNPAPPPPLPNAVREATPGDGRPPLTPSCGGEVASLPLALVNSPAAPSYPLMIEGPSAVMTRNVDAIDESLEITQREVQQKSLQRIQSVVASKGCCDSSVSAQEAAGRPVGQGGADGEVLDEYMAVAARGTLAQNPLYAFTYPMGMMCVRMAQALPNSDADTLRLLQKAVAVFDPDDSNALLPLAFAHSQCMAHFHSSSPLVEAEKECVKHARAAVNLVGRHHMLAVLREEAAHAPTNDRGPCGAGEDASTMAGTGKPVDAARMVVLEEEEDRISGMVLRCMCAVALEKVAQSQLGSAIEPLSVAQDALWLRERNLPRELLTYEQELPPAHIPIPKRRPPLSLAGTPAWVQSRSLRRSYEAAAAAFLLEALVGDIHALLAREYSLAKRRSAPFGRTTMEDAVFDEHCRLQVLALARQSMVPSDSVFNFVERLTPFTHDIFEHLDEARRAYTRAIQTASFCHAQTHELKMKRAAILAQRAAEKLECGLRLEAQTALPEASDPSASAGPATGAADAKQSESDAEVEDYTRQALAGFREARDAFKEAGSAQNVVMMTLNEAKMALRLAKMACGPNEHVMAVREATQLRGAMQCLEESAAWLHQHETTVTRRAVGMEDTSATELLASTTLSVYLLVAQRVLHALGSLCAAAGESPDPSSLGALFPQHHERSGSSPAKVVEGLVHDHLLLPALRVGKRLGAVKEYRVLEMIIEVHMQFAGVQSGILPQPSGWVPHMRADPKSAPFLSHMTDAERVESARWFISRCRQALAITAAKGIAPQLVAAVRTSGEESRTASRFGLLGSLVLSTMTLAGYTFLLQHAHAISSSQPQSGTSGPLQCMGTGDGPTGDLAPLSEAAAGQGKRDDAASTQKGPPCNLGVCLGRRVGPQPDAVEDATLEVVERAATTLFSALPGVHEYHQLLLSANGETPLTGTKEQSRKRAPVRKSHQEPCHLPSPCPGTQELALLTRICEEIMTAAARTMMALAKTMNTQLGSEARDATKRKRYQQLERKRDEVKACAAAALRAPSTDPAAAETTVPATMALLADVRAVLERIGDIFEHKRKTQRSVFL